jgi:predicted RNA-binding protein (virulence factor B family)
MKKIIWAQAVKVLEHSYQLVGSGRTINVPKNQTLGRMDVGQEYLLLAWEENGKYIGSEKISDQLSSTVPPETYTKNKKLAGIVFQQTDLGYKVFFDQEYYGVLFTSEVFTQLQPGQEVTVYIKNIREDFRVDLSLQPVGYKVALQDAQSIILQKLDQAGGLLKLSDKSSPEEISNMLGISKKKFKDTIGTLYKQKKIAIREDGISKI